ncbi:MAG: lysophospholipid acyltransferase family protein [Caldisericaceae bacterium]|nr:lysophospholipid acyltransferase family protein [Caldisericaceae bacterium]
MKRQYTTSLFFNLFKTLSNIILKLMGWKTTGRVPEEKKFVMIGYPHTSNWDAFIGLLVFTAMGLRLHWLAKQSLFKWPLGPILRFTGAIPVNRSQSQNFIEYSKQLFNQYDRLILTLSPEGSRKKTAYWRTGFYYMALNAGVPIVLGFLDYSRKTGGFGPLIWPGGNIEQDLKKIRQFYQGIKGKFPELMGEIQLNPERKKN